MGTHGNTIKIAPSILSADFAQLGAQVAQAESGGADAIHVDVMDGHFVPNITVGPLVVEAVRRHTSLPLHVHLMIERPADFIHQFIDAGANLLIVHQEGNWNPHRLVQEIKSAGIAAGIALNPMTPVNTLEEIVPFVDLVLLMTVEPGFGGQAFIPTMYEKVNLLRRRLNDRRLEHIDIEVDGGVNLGTARQLVKAGATVLVAGAAIFAAECSVGAAITRLRAVAEGTAAGTPPHRETRSYAASSDT